MSDFILHHYPFSPYAEKTRAILNYTGIDYLSVIHSEMPPRKYVEGLAGDYARIPVAQIGSDIFCDTKIICAELARISNKSELDYYQANQEVKDFVQHVEGKIFFASVLSSGSPQARKKMLQQMGWLNVAKFVFDRINMMRTATTKNMIKMNEAKNILREHLVSMESRLQDDFIFGDKPNIADFAAYPGLWLIRDIGEHRFINNYPKICAWMDRMKQLGPCQSEEITGEAAWDIARNTSPCVIDSRTGTHSGDIGKQVAIGPSDYRQSKTVGILCFEDDVSWVIERESERVGRVHVHFPKENYICVKK